MAEPWAGERGVRAPRLLGGRYEVGEAIGHGGMADVHLGFDTRLSRPVAIKLLRSDLVRDTNFLTRFRREAQSAAGLNHPSIVAIFDSGEDHGVDATGAATTVAFIVMEMVEGQTLRERLGTGPLPPEEAARITESVLAALAYSHRMGIVHRDIKPANVMLSHTGDVKVMDFGIARAIADTAATMTQTQAVLGTAQYLSPEQAQGMPVDARSDLYSTGCMLFELLTGRTPFVGDTPVAIAYQHVGEAPPRPSTLASGIPPAYDAVVLHAMVKDRDARYQSATEFRTDLIAARERRPLSPAAMATLQRTQSPDTPTSVLSGPRQGDPDTASLSPVGRDEDDEPRKRRGWAYVLLTVAALAALAGLVLLGRAILANRAEAQRVSVPYVIGKTEEQARTLIGGAGLVAEVRSVTDANAAKGTVTEQDPRSDAMVDRGSTVKLAVSSGPGQAAVPSVVGQPQDAAVATLTLAGFTSTSVVLVDDPSQSKGNVVSTDPAAAQVVTVTTPIVVKVASGKVKVPSVVGLDTSVAQLKVTELKLGYDDTQRVESTTVLEGKVVSQDVAADTLVDVGSTVKVKVAIRAAVTVTTTQTTTITAPPTTPTSLPTVTQSPTTR
ncbi:MAG: Stk1 family PASTA domain-containing Ser/Thr kinase [Dermatophilaceae bacterium]